MGKLAEQAWSTLQHRSVATRRDRFDCLDEKNKALGGGGTCILLIDGKRVDVSSWAKAHPGGVKVLERYNGQDASKAFRAVGHSDHAYSLLRQFCIDPPSPVPSSSADAKRGRKRKLWIYKLFTREDRFGVHRSLGLCCLFNYGYRYYHMLFGDPAAHLGSGKSGQPSIAAVLSLVPHGLLSLSSLLFHTVPKERVVGKPMIWKEFRAHNIIFGVRSLSCSLAAWCSIYTEHQYRAVAVLASGMSVLAACRAADWATTNLRVNETESTTATMPYWDGCSMTTMKLFKHFYALVQFGATGTCLMVSNPAWPFAVLLPIQGASFLMTLVRKGIISTKSYHMWYAASLLSVFGVGIRYILLTWNVELLILWAFVVGAYLLRLNGANKYAIWVPLVILRIALGDRYIPYESW